MIEQDYILRIIKDLGVLMQNIFNKTISRENVDVELNKLSEEWIGLPSSMLLSLPADEVFRIIKETERLVFEKSYLMAELSRAKFLLSESAEEQEDHRTRALYFYSKCSGYVQGDFLKEIDQHITELTPTAESLADAGGDPGSA